ncbi:hypothetical protein Glove_117g394 [Diversispora epigaea]|uniref:Uncharacterized protein n=1 Tax=Diversispora epigaea TaxID=1348612 RepID=A0A397J4T6_9GLOM|nr:hypothetical protein Glove_117g394 [Diversispora epigaea]
MSESPRQRQPLHKKIYANQGICGGVNQVEIRVTKRTFDLAKWQTKLFSLYNLAKITKSVETSKRAMGRRSRRQKSDFTRQNQSKRNIASLPENIEGPTNNLNSNYNNNINGSRNDCLPWWDH